MTLQDLCKNGGFVEITQNSHRIIETAIFLDEFIPFHSDYLYQKQMAPVTAERYYPLLNNFFDRVEKALDVEVIIAAHPKSWYDKLPDYFNGRRVVKGDTCQLVRGCKAVIAHSSTSVNFAVLYYKPVILITCADLDKDWFGDNIRAMAKELGKKPIFIG